MMLLQKFNFLINNMGIIWFSISFHIIFQFHWKAGLILHSEFLFQYWRLKLLNVKRVIFISGISKSSATEIRKLQLHKCCVSSHLLSFKESYFYILLNSSEIHFISRILLNKKLLHLCLYRIKTSLVDDKT